MTENNREALLLALLPDVPFDGWGRHAVLAAGQRLGLSGGEAATLFPGGPRDLVAEFSRWADRQMLARLDHLDLSGLKTPERVAAAVMARVEAVALYREATRRALAVLARPTNAPLAARLIYETVDAIWYAVGDRSVDFSFYTKRGMLAGILAVTTLYWLEDRSANFTETRGFLERRLAEIGALPRWRQRLAARLDTLPRPSGLARAMRGR
ncbi:MAG TPA: COQ9 family protein [Stellaceae bacterium]|nr:COQ9 family protein [Stellaceae bacterium]